MIHFVTKGIINIELKQIDTLYTAITFCNCSSGHKIDEPQMKLMMKFTMESMIHNSSVL